ncbi:MAG: hypothetical protein IT448_08165 [Phycisphaerales bacterium]|nr:hypothetical protein [Phycisphaerales bacterium]
MLLREKPPNSCGWPRSDPGGKLAEHLLLWLVAYAMLIVLGAAGLLLPGIMAGGNELPPSSAIFMSINAATLSGLDHNIPVTQYLLPGQLIVLGLMIGGALMSLIIGGIAVSSIMALPYAPRQIVRMTLIFYIGAVVIVSLLLLDDEHSTFDAVFLACSTIGNVGLILGHLPAQDSWKTHLVLLPLALAGSLGIAVLIDVRDRILGRRACLSHFSSVVLTLTAGLYLICVLGALIVDPSQLTALTASILAINTRSGGLSFHYADAFPRYVQWLVMGLMLMGSASGSTSGGLSLDTVGELWLGCRRSLKGITAGRSFGLALLWAGIYFLCIAAAQVLLTLTEPQIPADRLLFETISAIGNVGLSFGPVTITSPGIFVLGAIMLVGRFVPLLILIHLARATSRAGIVTK